MVYRPGSRFGPSDLGAVRRYLRNMVERKYSDCLTTMDVYEDEPWLLDHVSNRLFYKNRWYYFVPRAKRSRIVKGRGDSEGGTWKSTGKKVDIVDGNKKVMGYKRSLVFLKKVNGQPKPTNWLMTQFSLHKDGREFQDLVLVLIRCKKKIKNDNNLLGFNYAPRVDREHGEVPQVHEEDVDLDEYVNELERTMLEEEEEEEDPQQNTSDLALLPLESNYNKDKINELERMMLGEEDLQQNTSDLPLAPQRNYYNDMMMLPPLPPSMVGQGFGFETMTTTTQSRGNNFLMESNDNDLTMLNNVLMGSNDNNFLVESFDNNVMTQNDFFMQSNDNNFFMQSNENVFMHNNDNNVFMQSNENNNNFFIENNENGFLMQSNGNNFMTQNNENDFMTHRWNQEEQHRLADLGFEGAESVMLDLDQLLGEPITYDYNQEKQDHKV